MNATMQSLLRQLLISRITGQVGTSLHFSGKRVYQYQWGKQDSACQGREKTSTNGVQGSHRMYQAEPIRGCPQFKLR
jgi:hypothetical protein